MLNRFHLLTAVCLTAGAGLFVSNVSLAYQGNPNLGATVNRTSDTTVSLPPGVNPKELNADKSVEKAFAAVTNDAMDKTGFDNLVSNLVDQDRNRIKQSLNNNSLDNVEGDHNKRLTDLIADIDGTWKSKYGHNFDLDYSKAFNTGFIHVVTGEVNDPQQLVGKWPVDPGLGRNSTAGKVTQNDADIAKNKSFGGDVNLEKGRNIAIAHFMDSGNMNGLNASLIHEAGGWKFDIPNNVSGQKLYNNLVNNLTYIDQHKDQLPSDVNEGYRQVAHAVAAALYDVPLNANTGTAGNMNQGVQPTGGTVINK